jgi:hypothetical protein
LLTRARAYFLHILCVYDWVYEWEYEWANVYYSIIYWAVLLYRTTSIHHFRVRTHECMFCCFVFFFKIYIFFIGRCGDSFTLWRHAKRATTRPDQSRAKPGRRDWTLLALNTAQLIRLSESAYRSSSTHLRSCGDYLVAPRLGSALFLIKHQAFRHRLPQLWLFIQHWTTRIMLKSPRHHEILHPLVLRHRTACQHAITRLRCLTPRTVTSTDMVTTINTVTERR